jgi:hypothetical protein
VNARHRIAAAAALAVTVTGCGHHRHPVKVEAAAEPQPVRRPPEAADPTSGLTEQLDMAAARAFRPRATRSRQRAAVAASSRAAHPSAGGSSSCTLAVIRERESGGDYSAVSSSGKYRGAYQFDARTWASVGGTGDPAAASPEEQDARAAELMRQRGTQPWSVCR